MLYALAQRLPDFDVSPRIKLINSSPQINSRIPFETVFVVKFDLLQITAQWLLQQKRKSLKSYPWHLFCASAEGNQSVTPFSPLLQHLWNPLKDPHGSPDPVFGTTANDHLIHSLVFQLVRRNCPLSRPSAGEQVVGPVSLLYFAPPTSSSSPPV